MSARCAAHFAMSMRDRVAICHENILRPRLVRVAIAVLACLAFLAGCGAQAGNDPTEIHAVESPLGGAAPLAVDWPLERGVYLVESKETGIDVRLTVGTDGARKSFENRLPRHGMAYAVVSLERPAVLHIEISSADHPTRRGPVSVRILRWQRQPGEPAGELESGYAAAAAAATLAALATPQTWEQAVDKLHEAVSHFEAAGADRARADAAYTLADIQFGVRDQFAAAVRACETASAAYARAGDDVGVQNASTLRAAAETELAARMNADTQRAEQRALFADADRRLAEATEFFLGRALPVRAQYAVNMRAVRAVNMGEYAEAATQFARAVDLARQNQDVREESRALGNLAAVHIYLGHMAQAAAEYDALLPLIDRKQQPYQYAAMLANLGVTLIALGDFDRALAVHTEALEIYTDIGKEEERAVQLAALGVLYFRIGDTNRALETLKSAIASQERVGDTLGLASTLRVAGNVASSLGQHAAALQYLRWSARIDGNPISVARTRVLIAGELRSTGDLTAADVELGVPLKSGNTLVLASALEERARIRVARDRTADAVADYRAANDRYTELGLEMNRIDTNTALSRLLLQQGDLSGAGRAADEAIAIVSRVRVKSVNPEWRARFLSTRYSPYEARIAVDLASGDHDAVWRTFRTAEAVRGRSLADELARSSSNPPPRDSADEEALRVRLTAQQLRLESRIQRTDIDEVGTQKLRREVAETRAQIDSLRARRGIAATTTLSLPESLQQVQRLLPEDGAVLAYFIGDVDGHAWLLTRNALRHGSIAAGSVLESAIVAAQREERGGNVVGPANRDLAARLLGDLLDGVRARRLLVLPDGPLSAVAFAALPIPRGGGQMIVDRFVLASAPSLTLALASPARGRSVNTRVAVVYDPVYAPDDRRLALAARKTEQNLRGPESAAKSRLTRLPYSALEASAVDSAFGSSDTIQLAGFDATPARVLQLPSRDLAVLHFATHAIARVDVPEQSALYLSGYSADGTSIPNSVITVTDIARSGLRADLVVLSGCATGDGNALRGEGVLGLTYGFLANGAHSVVASLWPIEDASTAYFMNEFYRAYRSSGRAAEALRAAQLRTRAKAPSGVWSGFVVRANDFP